MAERNVNLLLSDEAAPDNGLALGNVIQWFGGPFTADATGDFQGATAEIMVCAEAPKDGDRQDYTDNPGDYDWVSLHEFTEPGQFTLANLNPCGLAIQISDTVADEDEETPGTRVRVIITGA